MKEEVASMSMWNGYNLRNYLKSNQTKNIHKKTPQTTAHSQNPQKLECCRDVQAGLIHHE